MSNKKSYEAIAGSWIVDVGPGQMKVFETYIPIGEGKFTATGMGFNFDWTLGGAKPTMDINPADLRRVSVFKEATDEDLKLFIDNSILRMIEEDGFFSKATRLRIFIF